jgi:hypothetical protein
MNDNTVVGHVGTPELSGLIAAEIQKALQELEKGGYSVQFEEVPDKNELAIAFKFGESKQTLHIKKPDWEDPRKVYEVVLNRLNI